MTIFLDYIIKSEIKKEYIKKNVYKILERNLKNGEMSLLCTIYCL